MDLWVQLPLLLIPEHLIMDTLLHCAGDWSSVPLINPQTYLRETLQRLPLADAVVHLLGYALDDDFLAACYHKQRGQCYEDILPFPCLVRLLTDALLVHGGS